MRLGARRAGIQSWMPCGGQDAAVVGLQNLIAPFAACRRRGLERGSLESPEPLLSICGRRFGRCFQAAGDLARDIEAPRLVWSACP